MAAEMKDWNGMEWNGVEGMDEGMVILGKCE